MSYGEHRVLVMGAAGLDMKVQPRTEVIESARSNPARIWRGWGGVARNIAENLVRLGADVQLITAVGDDNWGAELLQHLNDLDIGTEAVVVSPDKSTASYVGVHHADKKLWVAFDDMQVIQEITPAHLERWRYLFTDADIICIDANLSPATLDALFRIAQEYEIPVCGDPTAALLAHRFHPHLNQMMAVTPDMDEAMALVGEELIGDEGISYGARRLVNFGVELAVITLGAEGLYYATSDENGRLPAFPVDVVDPTGAGDALTAAVAYGLLENISPEEAVRLGMAAAAQTITCPATVCPDLDLEMLYERLTA
jgi:pseudouridine kinase